MKQCHVPRPFERFGQFALVCGADSRNPPREYLAPLRNKRREQPLILKINVVNLLGTKLAKTLTPDQETFWALSLAVRRMRSAALGMKCHRLLHWGAFYLLRHWS